MTDTRNIGQQAEERACVFLQAEGLTLLKRNYHCPYGEIDLIMQDSDEVVFVEVRKRTHANFGSPVESISFSKQKRLVKAAIHYLQKKRWFGKVQCRFDIIGITQNQLEWLKDAFSDESDY